MQKRTKITLASAIVAALAMSAVIAGAAFAATPTTTSAKPAAVSVAADTDNVDLQSGSQANDATEIAGVESEKDGPAETDGIDHQFEGQETGNNGDGVEAPGASSK